MAAGENSDALQGDHSRDELEHWLSDLRTETAADPSAWADGQSLGNPTPGKGDHPFDRPEPKVAEVKPPEPQTAEPQAAEPKAPEANRGGRHRAAD